MHLFIRPIILIFILKRKVKDNNACSMLCLIYLKSIDDVKMCKTKYLVYFIAIRSSVSNLKQENSIIDPFSMCVLSFRDGNSCFKKIKRCSRNKF